MAVAEMVDKLQAICVVCGDPACRNQRLIDGKPARYDSPTIMIGGGRAIRPAAGTAIRCPAGTKIRRRCCRLFWLKVPVQFHKQGLPVNKQDLVAAVAKQLGISKAKATEIAELFFRPAVFSRRS